MTSSALVSFDPESGQEAGVFPVLSADSSDNEFDALIDVMLASYLSSSPASESDLAPAPLSITPPQRKQSVSELDDQAEVRRLHREAIEKHRQRQQRRRQQRRKHFFPRILKKDVRRDLAAMFVNTLNSADAALIASFYSTYGHPDCVAVDIIPLPHTQQVWRLESRGVRRLVQRTCAELAAAPDLVLRLQSASIVHSASSSGSRVVGRVRIESTNMASLLHHALLAQGDSSSMASFLSSITAAHQLLPIGSVRMEITVVFHLDANCVCTSVELLF